MKITRGRSSGCGKPPARLTKPIGILADLQGPKIRTGLLKDKKPVQLLAGQRFTISIHPIMGTSEGVSTTYKRMAARRFSAATASCWATA